MTKNTLAVCIIWLILIAILTLPLNNYINTSVFLHINNWGNLYLHKLFILHITELGNGTIAITITLLVLSKYPEYSKQVLLTAVLLSFVSHYTKSYFDMPRPVLALGDSQFFILDKIATSNSFPSGHAATFFSLVALVWFNSSNALLKNILLMLAVLTGLSRIVVGVHFPVDVVFGALLGWAVGFSVCKIIKIDKTKADDFINKLIIIILSVLAFLSVLILRNQPLEFTDSASIYLLRDFMAIISILIIMRQLFEMRKIVTILFKKLNISDLPIHWRFFKFGLVGSLGFVIDTGVYLLLSTNNIPHLNARAISYWISASINWFLNRIFTFKDAPKTTKIIQWMKYLLMASGSFTLNWGTYYLLTEYTLFFNQYKMMAFVAGVGMGTLFNFSVSHWVIFKPETRTSEIK